MNSYNNRADWMGSKFGVFIHYLPDQASATKPVDCSVDQWNTWIDNFDVDSLAKQLSDVGADYLIITLGQNSGFYLSPNVAYDEIVDRDVSRLSKRDLVVDLCDALLSKGIKMLTYVSSHAPSNDLFAVENLGCTPEWDASKWGGLKPGTYKVIPDIDERLSIFQRNWERILREWSLRWGGKVSGWWVDGCYYNDILYRNDDEPNFASFAAALRAGNPNAVITFNSGVKVPIIRECEYDDYTAGELSNAFAAPNIWDKQPEFINGARYHAFTYMGLWWGVGKKPRMPDSFAVGYTQLVTSAGGAMTWDVPVSRTGIIAAPFVHQLESISKNRKI